jgi:hypothetical protein
MPSGKIHRAISKKRTGKTYAELHEWIDKGEEGHNVDHRKYNHAYTTKDREYVEKNFGGKEAVSEWLFHIAIDNLHTSVINDWNFRQNKRNAYHIGFAKNGYIHYDEQTISDSELKEMFDEEEDEGFSLF